MPLRVQCRCGAAYTLGEEFAGQRVRCKHCRAEFAVPAPKAEAPAAPDPLLADDDLLAGKEVEEVDVDEDFEIQFNVDEAGDTVDGGVLFENQPDGLDLDVIGEEPPIAEGNHAAEAAAPAGGSDRSTKSTVRDEGNDPPKPARVAKAPKAAKSRRGKAAQKPGPPLAPKAGSRRGKKKRAAAKAAPAAGRGPSRRKKKGDAAEDAAAEAPPARKRGAARRGSGGGGSRKTTFIIVGVVAAIVLVGVIGWMGSQPPPPIRPGTFTPDKNNYFTHDPKIIRDPDLRLPPDADAFPAFRHFDGAEWKGGDTFAWVVTDGKRIRFIVQAFENDMNKLRTGYNREGKKVGKVTEVADILANDGIEVFFAKGKENPYHQILVSADGAYQLLHIIEPPSLKSEPWKDDRGVVIETAIRDDSVMYFVTVPLRCIDFRSLDDGIYLQMVRNVRGQTSKAEDAEVLQLFPNKGERYQNHDRNAWKRIYPAR